MAGPLGEKTRRAPTQPRRKLRSPGRNGAAFTRRLEYLLRRTEIDQPHSTEVNNIRWAPVAVDCFRRSAEEHDPTDMVPLIARERSFALRQSDGKVCPFCD